MNLIHRIFSYFLGNATGQQSGKQSISPSVNAHDNTPVIGVDSALQVSTVWACVNLLVETISSLPLVVYRSGENGRREKAKGTRIYTILHDAPNKRQTSQEFWEQMILNFALRGNAYARIVKDGKGETVALWPLSADQVEVLISDDGKIIYLYSYDSTTIAYDESDILHIRGMGNGVVGMSPLDYMRSSVGLAIAAQNHTTKTFQKGARRPGVLMSDSVLSPDQRKALKENFGDIVSGGEKELYILEAQFKFEPLGMSPADIQLLESRQFAVQDLARWFGVPSILINDTAQSSSLGSSAQQIINGFYKLKLRPQLSRIEQAIVKRVLNPRQRSLGMTVEFNLDALLRSSLMDRMEIGAKGVQNGLITRNEWREKENKKPIEGGDMLTAQVNLMPVEKLGEQTSQGGSVPEETVKQITKVAAISGNALEHKNENVVCNKK